MRNNAVTARRKKTTAAAGADAPLGKQALKTLRTREAILGAVIALIKEGGYSHASSSRIAERAGITWGAAQHHFGNKEEILDAVMNLAHERFAALMAEPKLRNGSLAERVDGFIETMWAHYQDDVYLAMLEILLATRGFHEEAPANLEERFSRDLQLSLREIFAAEKLDDPRARELLNFTHCFLTGLTIERVFEPKLRNTPRYLQRLKTMVQGILQGG
ncbi:MAG TPA: TetR/AcrR family transcriptional regulator [Ramlibacter sp.]|nr:TetR/AcrR family transcriptional regulator [Ramlibacter sp.]